MRTKCWSRSAKGPWRPCYDWAAKSPRSQDLVERMGERGFKVLLDVVTEMDAQGRLRNTTPAAAAQVLWASGHGLASLLITQLGRQWSPADELTKALLDGMFDGLVSD
ncbi:MAG: TetR-like C-terminal domain-containing protein [Alphaproteobacteria bacterium]